MQQHCFVAYAQMNLRHKKQAIDSPLQGKTFPKGTSHGCMGRILCTTLFRTVSKSVPPRVWKITRFMNVNDEMQLTKTTFSL